MYAPQRPGLGGTHRVALDGKHNVHYTRVR
eukprot:gene14400-biopygen5111